MILLLLHNLGGKLNYRDVKCNFHPFLYANGEYKSKPEKLEKVSGKSCRSPVFPRVWRIWKGEKEEYEGQPPRATPAPCAGFGFDPHAGSARAWVRSVRVWVALKIGSPALSMV